MKRAVHRIVLAALVVIGGCADDPRAGYSFKSTYAESVRTVAVPVFDNATFATEVDAQLTEAVIKEIQRVTPWRVTREAAADATLAAVVRSADMSRLSADPVTGLVQEQAYQVSVDFDLKDNRTGRVIVSRRGFAATDSFVPARGTGEPLEVGQNAVVQRLARDIVHELRSGW